jgi:N-acetylmuramoyl-L-alanine amidase
VPLFIVLHSTGTFSAESAIDILCDPTLDNPVSAHVVVDWNGDMTQLVPFNEKAWHAGESTYATRERTFTNLNTVSIGVELVNPGWFLRGEDGAFLHAGVQQCPDSALAPFPGIVEGRLPEGITAFWTGYSETQIEIVEELVRALLVAYPGIQYIVGHDQIAPRRKVDPGPAFPMARIRALLNPPAAAR